MLTLAGDQRVVNCLQMHPHFPSKFGHSTGGHNERSYSVLASSGIDYDVKVWLSIAEAAGADPRVLTEVGEILMVA